MFFNILKKDLKRKKSMNVILLIFITLCATFMASSVSNLSMVLNAINYFGIQTNVTDYFILSKSDEVKDWLSDCSYVTDYQKDTGISVAKDNFKLENGEFEAGTSTFLFKLPKQYNLLLDGKNEPITSLDKGEIALSYLEASRHNLKIGDKITIILGDESKTFTLTIIMKDMLFGSQYMDPKRIIISDSDYNLLLSTGKAATINLYSITTDDTKSFVKDFQKQNFNTFYHFDKMTLNYTFTMEMVLASIMIVVSICLIAIALVILRFTIVFTLQDDYREIGVMKAIGLRNLYIKKLYIIKYLALSVVGSIIGVIISVPFGNMMTENLKNNIAMESSFNNLLINILCGLVIVTIVVFFCYINTGKVNKFTAIQAIRSGSTGERFTKQKFFYLNKSKKIPTMIYLALNSIISAFKSYSILFVAFILGTLLVILPLNAVNTLNSDDIIKYFSTIKTDVYIDNLLTNDYIENGSIDYIMNDLNKLRQLYKENDADIEFNILTLYLPKIYIDNPDEVESILGVHSIAFDISELGAYTDGTPPKLANEIAITDIVMERLGLVIGDSVNIIAEDTEKSYIVTGSFQSMNNMGRSIIFSNEASLNLKNAISLIIQGNFVNGNDIKGQLSKIKELTPQYTIRNATEYVSMYIGGIADTINEVKTLLLVVMLFINCLITVLLMRTFITREVGEIALMKNIGFKDKSIKLWQALRIIITLFISVIVGVLLSNPFNFVMAKYTFGLMGALDMPITINAFEVYFLYPTILFIGTSIAAVLSTRIVNKINFRNINAE